MTRNELRKEVKEIKEILQCLEDFLSIDYIISKINMQTNQDDVLIDVLLLKVRKVLTDCYERIGKMVNEITIRFKP